MSRLIPRGVVVAGLGKRFLAAVIDYAPLAAIYGVLFLVMRLSGSPAIHLVAIIGACVLAAGYGLYQWWAYASRGAGIGARAMGLRLVSLKDGEPIGWWRFFLRQLVFGALMGTVIGGIALLVFLVIHERRQGWHDMVGGAVMVEPKPSERAAAAPQKKVPTTSTVGLPPHLSSTFSPQVGSSSDYAPHQQAAQQAPPQAPDWLPGVQSEPIGHQGQQGQTPWPGQPQQGQAPAQQPWQAPQQQPWQAPQQQPFHPQSAPGGQQFPAQNAPGLGGQPFHAPSAPGLGMSPVEPVSPSRSNQNWIPIPTPSSVIEPRQVRVRQRDFGEVEDDEGTRIANLPPAGSQSRAGNEGWYARLDDGREVELTVTVLLGRNPQKADSDPDEVHLVPASGDGRMISRTHVLIGTDPRGVYVVDRGSTNGTALVTSGGDLEPCPAGTQVRVKEGQQVSYGNRWFTVLRRPVAQ